MSKSNKLILDCPSPELVQVLLGHLDATHTSMKFDIGSDAYCDGVSMEDMCDQYFDIKFSVEFASDSGDRQMSDSGDKLDVLKSLMRLSDKKAFPFRG